MAAFLLGWVFPGFGQWVLGRRRRAVLIAVSIVGMVSVGVLVGGADVVDREEDRMWFVPQALAGPIVFGVDLVNQTLLKTGRVGEIVSFDVNERNTRQDPVNRYKSIGRVNELGTLFVALAGLMNLCMMFDAATRSPGTGDERSGRPTRERRAAAEPPAA